MPEVWCESELLPQMAPAKSKSQPARQTIAELAQVCHEQAGEIKGGLLSSNTPKPSEFQVSYAVLQPGKSSSTS